MDSSNLKFRDIATIAGFTNQYYFSKVFKLITGLSPTDYKNGHAKL
ncbi:helix-turn-helix domain-containing protein [Paenibacillus agricola]|uniref:AraC family transcriptional regulator n=1 Tax=Paenibacillus agricola TaxID=2716264 RepID=A0ABX0J760_9BACL|nr:AraC family transcriptional regulator [Paenibacillus agricola]